MTHTQAHVHTHKTHTQHTHAHTQCTQHIHYTHRTHTHQHTHNTRMHTYTHTQRARAHIHNAPVHTHTHAKYTHNRVNACMHANPSSYIKPVLTTMLQANISAMLSTSQVMSLTILILTMYAGP